MAAGIFEAIEHCADDLESELHERWCTELDGGCHPALQRKLDRDMAVVTKAREGLEIIRSFVEEIACNCIPGLPDEGIADAQALLAIDLNEAAST